MLQFSNKADPSNEYKHIIVSIPRSAIVAGFSCFKADETVTYSGEQFDENQNLVPFTITGKELRKNYELYDPEGHVSFAWHDVNP